MSARSLVVLLGVASCAAPAPPVTAAEPPLVVETVPPAVGEAPVAEAKPPPATGERPQCDCGDKPCPATYAEARLVLRRSCTELGFVLIRSTGCGLVQLHAGYATEGSQYFYDERDGRLVAAGHWFDVAVSPCPGYPPGGALPECPGATECTVCGQYRGMPECPD